MEEGKEQESGEEQGEEKELGAKKWCRAEKLMKQAVDPLLAHSKPLIKPFQPPALHPKAPPPKPVHV